MGRISKWGIFGQVAFASINTFPISADQAGMAPIKVSLRYDSFRQTLVTKSVQHFVSKEINFQENILSFSKMISFVMVVMMISELLNLIIRFFSLIRIKFSRTINRDRCMITSQRSCSNYDLCTRQVHSNGIEYLVLWLWEETHDLEVVGSNPRTVFFTYFFCKNCDACLKRKNEKEAGDGPLKNKGTLIKM